jgi:hypothetical protein
MEWPKVDSTGKVSTTVVNKRIWKAFLSPLVNKIGSESADDDEMTSRCTVRSDAVAVTKALDESPDGEWRHRYTHFVNTIIQIQARATPEEALQMCQAGLEAAHENMRFVTPSSSIRVSAKEAVVLQKSDEKPLGDDDDEFFLDSLVIYGQRQKSDEEKKAYMGWRVPASAEDPSVFRTIHGEVVDRQLQALAKYGCMEPSAASSASEIMVQKTVEEISKSLTDKVFVLLGATSELGPAIPLAELGTTIVAIARPGHKLQSLVKEIQDNTDSTLILPIKRKKEREDYSKQPTATTASNSEDELAEVGADLIHDTPQLARWIANLYPQKQLVIIPLAYLDGEANVRAVVAMDLIIEYVIQQRDHKKDTSEARTALAFLISPGTPHVITKEAAMDAKQRYSSSSTASSTPPIWQTALRFLPTAVGGFSKYCITDPPLPPHNFYVFNGLADMQGPNYALSKCIQQWRAMLAYSQGHCVSANVSPPAKTQSMVNHSQVAIWLNGIQAFPPMVVFDPSMARTLMTSLLVWDLTCSSSSDIASKKDIMYHPVMLFMQNSVHGGVWRFPYDLNSVGLVSFMIGKFMPSIGFPPKEVIVVEDSDE